MKYQYKVKNFRVFDEDGVKLDMAPITILTGCNSSGKSSLVKSMLLVNNVLKKMSNSGELRMGIKLDFTECPNNILGSFDGVLHKGSDSKEITIEYTVPSLFLNEDVVVSMTFKRHWQFNGGKLSDVSISDIDGKVIFQYDDEDDERIKEIECCKDLRTSFFKYAFAINNKSLLLDIRDGHFDKTLHADIKADEKVKDYYICHKEWIDKLLPGIIMHPLVPYAKRKYKNPFLNGLIQVSNEQIYKENLLYSNVLDSLLNANVRNFGATASSIIKNDKNPDLNEVALCLVDIVEKDFVDSDFELFSDYFNHVYNDFFKQRVHIHNHKARGLYESLSGVDSLTGETVRLERIKENCGKNPLSDIYNLIKVITIINDPSKIMNIYSRELPNWYVAYNEYVKLVMEEILSYRIPTEISYIPTSIINIKRLYSFDEKDQMTNLLKDYLHSESEYPEDGTWGFSTRWLRKLDIGYRVSVKPLADSNGCEVRIYQENDKEGQLLADFGYGISQVIALLLRIETEGNRWFPVMNGTSYTDYEKDEERELRIRYRKPLTIVLEEPEVHLHPKYQSMIADLLLDAYNYFNFHFIVETHSEYLIRRSQVLVSKMGFRSNVESVEKSPFITYYIPEDSKPYSLGYRKDGKFMESFGTGFYDEASNLSFELL